MAPDQVLDLVFAGVGAQHLGSGEVHVLQQWRAVQQSGELHDVSCLDSEHRGGSRPALVDEPQQLAPARLAIGVAREVRAITRGERNHHVFQRRQVRKQRIVLKHETDAALLRWHEYAPLGIEPGLAAAHHRACPRQQQTGDGAQD